MAAMAACTYNADNTGRILEICWVHNLGTEVFAPLASEREVFSTAVECRVSGNLPTRLCEELEVFVANAIRTNKGRSGKPPWISCHVMNALEDVREVLDEDQLRELSQHANEQSF